MLYKHVIFFGYYECGVKDVLQIFIIYINNARERKIKIRNINLGSERKNSWGELQPRMLHVHVTMHNLRVNDTFIACLFSIENCSRAQILRCTLCICVCMCNASISDISYDFHMLDIQQSYTYMRLISWGSCASYDVN